MQSPRQPTSPTTANAIKILKTAAAFHDAVLETPEDVHQQLECIRSLLELSDFDSQTLLGESGCIEASITAIRQHPENLQITQLVCGFLTNCLANTEQNQRRFMEHCGIEVLTSLLIRHVTDSKTVEQVLKTLENAVSCLPEAQKEVQDLAFMNLSHGLMKRYSSDDEILSSCIRIVGYMVKTSLYAQKEARESNTIDELIQLVKQRQNIIPYVCLETLCVAAESNPSNQRYILNHDGMNTIYEYLNSNIDDSSMLVPGIKLLQALVRQESGKTLAIKLGLLDAVLSSLTTFFNEVDTDGMILTLLCISNMLFQSEHGKKAFCEANGFFHVQKVLKQNEGQTEILTAVLRIYRNVVDGNEVISVGISNEMFDSAVNALRNKKMNEEVSQNGFSVLLGLYAESKPDDNLGKEELKELITRHMEVFGQNNQIRSIGQDLLRRLGKKKGNSEGKEQKGKFRKAVHTLIFLKRAGTSKMSSPRSTSSTSPSSRKPVQTTSPKAVSSRMISNTPSPQAPRATNRTSSRILSGWTSMSRE